MKQCLNVGCGLQYIESTDTEQWTNVDIDPDVKTDWCGDACYMPDIKILHEYGDWIEDGWGSRFDHIYSHHSLEHFKDLIQIVHEMVRVSKNGATWEHTVPYWTWSRNQGNPHHHIYFSEHTFNFFGKTYKRGHKESWSLEVLDIEYGWNRDYWDNEIEHRREILIEHLLPVAIEEEYLDLKDKYLNVVKDITFKIKVHK